MPRYLYQAKAANGQVTTGQIDATSEAEAQSRLKAKQLTPLRLVKSGGGPAGPAKPKPAAVSFFGGRVDTKELQIFTRQFSTLINAGIPIVDSLKILSEGKRHPLLQTTAAKVKESIEGGKRLGDAMAMHPNVFDRFFVNMVRAAKRPVSSTGFWAVFPSTWKSRKRSKSRSRGAMVYPAAIIFVSVLVVTGILVFIIPEFEKLYSSAGKELPIVTQIVVDMSRFCTQKWYILVSVVVAVPMALIQYYRTPDGRDTFDRLFIKAPVMGDLVQKSSIARMTRTLSTLLSSGVSVVEALDIASKTAGNAVVEEALVRSKESVISGRPLASPLAKEPLIPDMVTQMIAIGEKSGTLDQMLSKIADFYEDDVEAAVKALTSLIEPLLMVVLGAVIAFLVIAMYLPIFDMASVATGQ